MATAVSEWTCSITEAAKRAAVCLGCSYLSALNAGGNAHYTSEQELVGILAQQIEDAQLAAFSHSPFYGLMVDESTDISVTKQLVLYGQYVSESG